MTGWRVSPVLGHDRGVMHLYFRRQGNSSGVGGKQLLKDSCVVSLLICLSTELPLNTQARVNPYYFITLVTMVYRVPVTTRL